MIPRLGTDLERQEWIINSPPMVIGMYQGARFIDPADLPGIGVNATGSVKAEPETRLGKLYELLIKDLLEGQPLDYGKQIIKDGQTLGEVDFLIHTGSVPIHLETSIKFYVEWSPGFYIGPNGKDELEIKFSHMTNHQSKLLQTNYVEAGLDDVPEPCCLINGMLFKHISSESLHISSYVNDEVQQGVWVFESEIGQLQETGNTYQALHKHDWMLPLKEHAITLNEVRKLCLESTSATMLNIIDQKGQITKAFVIKDVLKQTLPHPYTPR